MSAWNGLNKRKFPRVKFPCLVIIKYEDKEPDVLLTHTENVGAGGVCVILKKQLKAYTPVALEIDLLDAEDHVKCAGKIVWSIRRKKTETKKPLFYDIGIEFVDIEQEDSERIEKVVTTFAQKYKDKVLN